MQLQIEDLSPVTKKLVFTIPAGDVNAKLAEAYKNLAGQVRMNGFRKGKVPRQVLEQRYGRQINAEVGGQVVSDAFDEAVQEHDLTVVAQPEVDAGQMKRGNDFTFTVTVEVKPALEVQGWEGMDIEWETVDVPDEQIDAELEQMRQREATVEAAEEGYEAAAGDYAMVDAVITAEGKDDKAFEALMVGVGGGGMGFPLADWLGGKVEGQTPGAVVEWDEEIPEGALDEEWNGVAGHIKLTVAEIKVQKAPELDDDFAQDVGFDSLDMLRADIQFKLTDAAGQNTRSRAAAWALDKLIETNEFDVGEGMVRREAEMLLEQNMRQFAAQGMRLPQMKLDDFPDENKARMLEEAEVSVRRSLLLDAIARQAEVEVTDADVDEKIEEMAEQMGQQPSAVKGLLIKRGGMDGLKDRIREEKALDTLLERANVIEVEPRVDEPEAPAEEAVADAEAPADDAVEAKEEAPAEEKPAKKKKAPAKKKAAKKTATKKTADAAE